MIEEGRLWLQRIIRGSLGESPRGYSNAGISVLEHGRYLRRVCELTEHQQYRKSFVAPLYMEEQEVVGIRSLMDWNYDHLRRPHAICGLGLGISHYVLDLHFPAKTVV